MNLTEQIKELEALDAQINSGLHESYGPELVEYHQKSKKLIREQRRLLVMAAEVILSTKHITLEWQNREATEAYQFDVEKVRKTKKALRAAGIETQGSRLSGVENNHFERSFKMSQYPPTTEADDMALLDCRKAFEHWSKSAALDLSGSQNDWSKEWHYVHSHVNAMWHGWKAAYFQRPTPPAPAPAVVHSSTMPDLANIKPGGFVFVPDPEPISPEELEELEPIREALERLRDERAKQPHAVTADAPAQDGGAATKAKAAWRSPSPVEVTSPEFNAIWKAIKGWDVSIPNEYGMYCGANGSHVCWILDAITPYLRTKPIPQQPTMDAVEAVGRAIYAKIAWAYKWDGNTPYERLNEHAKEVLGDIAEAAIAAMPHASVQTAPDYKALYEQEKAWRSSDNKSLAKEIEDLQAQMEAERPAQAVNARLLKALTDTLAGKAVRDMDEVVLEAENARQLSPPPK